MRQACAGPDAATVGGDDASAQFAEIHRRVLALKAQREADEAATAAAVAYYGEMTIYDSVEAVIAAAMAAVEEGAPTTREG